LAAPRCRTLRRRGRGDARHVAHGGRRAVRRGRLRDRPQHATGAHPLPRPCPRPPLVGRADDAADVPVPRRGRRARHPLSGPPVRWAAMSEETSQPSPPTVYDQVGGQPFFDRLVERFYRGVEADPVLRPMYPDDLAESHRTLSWFLAQYWGGPPDY